MFKGQPLALLRGERGCPGFVAPDWALLGRPAPFLAWHPALSNGQLHVGRDTDNMAVFYVHVRRILKSAVELMYVVHFDGVFLKIIMQG